MVPGEIFDLCDGDQTVPSVNRMKHPSLCLLLIDNFTDRYFLVIRRQLLPIKLYIVIVNILVKMAHQLPCVKAPHLESEQLQYC